MRILRYGLAILILLFISLTTLIGCAHFHQINFLNEACIIPLKGYNYKTCKDIRVVIDGKNFIIPKDFETDLASIPRALWPILAPQYTGFVAPAILHDYLYRCNNHLSRKYADEVLYSALITEDVTPYTASKFYAGVRLFGGSHYERGKC